MQWITCNGFLSERKLKNLLANPPNPPSFSWGGQIQLQQWLKRKDRVDSIEKENEHLPEGTAIRLFTHRQRTFKGMGHKSSCCWFNLAEQSSEHILRYSPIKAWIHSMGQHWKTKRSTVKIEYMNTELRGYIKHATAAHCHGQKGKPLQGSICGLLNS